VQFTEQFDEFRFEFEDVLDAGDDRVFSSSTFMAAARTAARSSKSALHGSRRSGTARRFGSRPTWIAAKP
jgi:hypothetical protein